jgi:UDP-2,3-diacylglucosamine pyrophosphatase LpxH
VKVEAGERSALKEAKMLIFISDLHFIDGTAGEHNVPTDAFKIFFEDIAGTVDWLCRDGRKIEEIKLIFLGDTFDLLRTEMWFDYPETERPWGNNEAKIEMNANTIFDAIINKNQATFELLSGQFKDKFGLPVEPERIYLPGNHDRLCNKYQSLRDKVCKSMGIPLRTTPFDHHFQDVEYAVFARHGHEYDKFNYEGSISYDYQDYMRVPIGDPIITELVAKLPWKIMQNKKIKKLPKKEREALRRNFQDIENVRPFSAVIEWLLYQVKKSLRLKDVIEDSIDEVIEEFERLKFVNQWYKHHDKWDDFLDEADKIQSVLFLLKKFKIFPMEKLIPYLARVSGSFAEDDNLKAAADEYAHLDNRIRYIVYGHTHEAKQVAIRVREDTKEPKEQVYLNTGTWRTRYYKTTEGLGFIGWKNLSYVSFFKKEERRTDVPIFETWTGTLKKV